MTSCKSYMEYTSGTQELSYSFDNKKLKRFSNLELALEQPLDVEFLDLHTDAEIKLLDQHIAKFLNLKKLVLFCSVSNTYFPSNIYECSSIEFLVLSGFISVDKACFNGLKKLNRLVFLGIQYSGLQELPQEIFTMKTIEGMDFTLNLLKYVPAEIAQLKNLRTIDLTNNCLTEFPWSLIRNEKIEWIDVNNAEGIVDNSEAWIARGVCSNNITYFGRLGEFKTLKELSIFKLISQGEISDLNKKYPQIKIN